MVADLFATHCPVWYTEKAHVIGQNALVHNWLKSALCFPAATVDYSSVPPTDKATSVVYISILAEDTMVLSAVNVTGWTR